MNIDTASKLAITGGKVGIGTSNPGAHLDIAGVATNSEEDALTIGVDGEQQANIKFYDDDTSDTQWFKIGWDAS